MSSSPTHRLPSSSLILDPSPSSPPRSLMPNSLPTSSSIQIPSSSIGRLSSLPSVSNQPGFFGPTGRISNDFLRQWASTAHIAGEAAITTDPVRNQDMDNPLPDHSDPALQRRLIWGTDISIMETISQFKDFLISYTHRHTKRYLRALELNISPDDVSDAGLSLQESDYDPVYPPTLQNLLTLNVQVLNLDTAHLRAYEPSRKLYSNLIKYPHEIVSIMDVTVTDLYKSVNNLSGDTDVDVGFSLSVRPFNLLDSLSLRALNPSDIDRLITIKGLMIRSTSVIPDLKVGLFKCQACQTTQEVELDRGRIEEPVRCPNQDCNALNTMQLIHNRCRFASKQVAKLQETPDMIPDGQTPFTVSLNFYDDLVDLVKPGDRVCITGIFRSMPIRINPRQRSIRPVFRTFVDVVHVKLVDPTRVAADQSTLADYEKDRPLMDPESTEFTVSEQEKAELQALSTRSDLYDYLSRSIAPSIYGMEDAKKSVLLQLFGGHHKSFGTSRYRGDINILLVGDPGVAKSQLLQYAHQISPRGVYTSGKGSSAVGLTASVVRDPDTNAMVLESGALVLSDGGICCIDEFDKMSDMTRSVLHEVMEQQTISVAKAGIITTLNARTSILASANPIKSKFDLKLSLVENINLVPSLLSRFDLLFVILDLPDESYDRRLARHLVELYMEDTPAIASIKEICPPRLLTKYLSFARKECFAPKLQQEACDELVRTYIDMRSIGSAHGNNNANGHNTVTATTRQLESMIRLAEAHAKMHLRHVVLKEDVQEAARLLREAIKQGATDPRTGRIDLDLLVSGNSRSHQHALSQLKTVVTDYLCKLPIMAKLMIGTLQLDLRRNSSIAISRDDLDVVLNDLQNSGTISYDRGAGVVRVMLSAANSGGGGTTDDIM